MLTNELLIPTYVQFHLAREPCGPIAGILFQVLLSSAQCLPLCLLCSGCNCPEIINNRKYYSSYVEVCGINDNKTRIDFEFELPKHSHLIRKKIK